MSLRLQSPTIIDKAYRILNKIRMNQCKTDQIFQDQSAQEAQVFTMTANLSGTIVAVKKMDVQRVEVNRKILIELKQVREVSYCTCIMYWHNTTP